MENQENQQYTQSQLLSALMHDLFCSNPDEMIFKEFRDRAKYLKEDPEGIKLVMQSIEDSKQQDHNNE